MSFLHLVRRWVRRRVPLTAANAPEELAGRGLARIVCRGRRARGRLRGMCVAMKKVKLDLVREVDVLGRTARTLFVRHQHRHH